MIYVFDKHRAEEFIPIVETIAIRCKSSFGVVYKELKGRYLDSLSLTFDDVLPIPKRFKVKESKDVVFGENHANMIADFLSNNFNKFKDVMISCDYGVSRSAALGVSLGNYFGWEYDPVILGDEHQHPNEHVYKTMNRVLEERFSRKS